VGMSLGFTVGIKMGVTLIATVGLTWRVKCRGRGDAFGQGRRCAELRTILHWAIRPAWREAMLRAVNRAVG